jgi:hypothetical protein
MADEPKTPDSDELILDTPVDTGEPRDAGDTDPDDEDVEEEIPAFGDDITEPKENDTGLVKHLRQVARDAQREAAELRKQVRQPETIEVGEKPTHAGCEYDEDKYEAELDAWKERKAAADRRTTEARTTNENQQRQIQERMAKLDREHAALGRPDADEALETVKAALGEAKLVGIAQLLDEETDGAKFFYALAKNPQQLEALASQGDYVRLLKQVTKLEGQLKMVKRRTPPNPDTPERGSGKIAVQPNAVRKELEKLEKEAEQSGDRTKVAAFKKKHSIRD